MGGLLSSCFSLQALRLRPDFAIALGNLASVYYEKRELRLAVQTYRRAVAIQPNFPDACEPSPVGEEGVRCLLGG